ncbi:hypothetical protein BH11PLA2_BH11PLA2_38350 [soil metagenome]
MLRATVSLSRKISRDYNSTGYTVSLDGEIPFPTSDSEGVLEKVNELFNLAQEALNVEIDRDQGNDAMGRRDRDPQVPPNNPPANNQINNQNNGIGHIQPHNMNNGHAQPSSQATTLPMNRPASSNGNGNVSPDAATPKQLQFLYTMASEPGSMIANWRTASAKCWAATAQSTNSARRKRA